MDEFLERFKKNLQYYSNLSQQQRQKDFNEIYGDFDLKEIYLAELLIVKSLLEQEKTTNNNSVNIDDFIDKIDVLYTEIDGLNIDEISQKKEEIELLIVSLKLALNSPVYIDVNLEKLKDYDFNDELGKYTQSNAQQSSYSLLKNLKETLDSKIESNKKSLTQKEEKIEQVQNIIITIEELQQNFNEGKIDGLKFLASALNLFQQGYSEITKQIVSASNGVINVGDKASKDFFNFRINKILSQFRREKEEIHSEIQKKSDYTHLMKTIAQNIGVDGRLIQFISNENIGKYIEYIQRENFEQTVITNMVFSLLKEQARLARKQKIEHIVNIIKENISAKYQANIDKLQSSNAKQPESMGNQNLQKEHDEITEEYAELLEQAKQIIVSEMNNRETSVDLSIDKDNEIEYIISQELQSDYIDKEKIEAAMEEIKNESSECQLRLIIHGLKYQIGNSNDNNMENRIALIKLYIKHYQECKKRIETKNEQVLQDEQQARQEFKQKQENAIEEASNLIGEIEDKISNCEIQYLPKEEKEFIDAILHAYEGIDLDLRRDELLYPLSSRNLDFETLKLYQINKRIKIIITELKTTIELIDEGLELEITDYLEMRKNIAELSGLLKNYSLIEEQYNQAQEKKLEELIEQQTTDNEDTPCIVVFFEWEDGTTQVEKRLISDSKVFGKYGPSEIKKVNYMINYFKNTMPDKIQKSAPVLGNSQKENRSKPLGYFGYRVQFGNSMRTAYRQLPGDVLETNKPVYLIESLGIKASNESEVYSDVTKNDAAIHNFIEKYKSLKNATPDERKLFIVRQQEHERRINELLQAEKERGNNDAIFK